MQGCSKDRGDGTSKAAYFLYRTERSNLIWNSILTEAISSCVLSGNRDIDTGAIYTFIMSLYWVSS